MRKVFPVLLTMLALGLLVRIGHADPLVWETPYGTVGLPLSASELLVGYDALLKQAIGGASVPVYTDPKNILSLQIGAVAPWPTNGAGVEPYIAAGHNIAKEIPYLKEFSSFHLNVFARYATSAGKAGLGVSAAYSFGS